MDRSAITGQAMNEFKTEVLETMPIPTLFPIGSGNLTLQARMNKASLTDAFRPMQRDFANSLSVSYD